ncbi:MAG: DNA-binding domain-containing protein, partial [Acidithiobacillus sp.]
MGADASAENAGACRRNQTDASENTDVRHVDTISAPGNDVMDSLMRMIGVGVSVDAVSEPAAATEPEAAGHTNHQDARVKPDMLSVAARFEESAAASLVSAPQSEEGRQNPVDGRPPSLPTMNGAVGSGDLTPTAATENATTDRITATASGNAPAADIAVNAAADIATTPGLAFISWLRTAILTRKILLNDAKALVHTVDDTIFLVSPGIFMRYAQEHPHLAAQAKAQEMPDWQWVQKQFEKSRLHRKQPDGLNIWTCEVSGPRKSRRLHGYLLQSFSSVLEDPIPNNPFLVVQAQTSN